MHLISYSIDAICGDIIVLPLAMFIQRLTFESQGRYFLLQKFKDDQQNKHYQRLKLFSKLQLRQTNETYVRYQGKIEHRQKNTIHLA